MEVFVAKNSGFCKGVEYAVNTALSLDTENAYVLGEIIHNADVVKLINDKGLNTVENLEEIPDGSSVVFRSHGVPKHFYGECKRRNIKVIDCTCGFVKRRRKLLKSKAHLVIIS